MTRSASSTPSAASRQSSGVRAPTVARRRAGGSSPRGPDGGGCNRRSCRRPTSTAASRGERGRASGGAARSTGRRSRAGRRGPTVVARALASSASTSAGSVRPRSAISPQNHCTSARCQMRSSASQSGQVGTRRPGGAPRGRPGSARSRRRGGRGTGEGRAGRAGRHTGGLLQRTPDYTELDGDARAHGLGRLGDRVVPRPLARAAHHDEVTMAEREAQGLASSPEARRRAGAG